jgi:GNAT superfamily N-acetyltransferase
MRRDADELERVDRLLMTAYHSPSRRAELELYLTVQPDGWFVIADSNRIAAAAGAIHYQSFCWIGLVATDPEHRRKGLATRLSAHLVGWAQARGCTTVALDASSAGEPVYERLGFQLVGFTLELSRAQPLAAGRSSPAISTRADPKELGRLDRELFGADRESLLTALVNDPDARCYRAGAGRRVEGFLFVRKRSLGPGCALDQAVARDLLRAAAQGCPDPGKRLLVPFESAYADLLRDLGWQERRRLTHMRLGAQALPGRRDRLLAQTSYAAG